MLPKLSFPLRIIAAILLVTFLAQDIAGSYPDVSLNNNNNKLAITGLQDQDTLYRLKAVLITSLIEKQSSLNDKLDEIGLYDIKTLKELDSAGRDLDGIELVVIYGSRRRIKEIRFYFDNDGLIVRYFIPASTDNATIDKIPYGYKDITKDVLRATSYNLYPGKKTPIQRQVLKGIEGHSDLSSLRRKNTGKTTGLIRTELRSTIVDDELADKDPKDLSTDMSAESVYKDYFETVFEFNIRLFVLLARRMNAKRLLDQGRSEKARSDIQECIGQLWKEIKGFEARAKDLPPDVQMVESHNKAKERFAKADELISQNNEPAANAALVGALNIISGARLEKMLEKLLSRPRSNVRVYEEAHKIVMWQQVYKRPDKESKTLVPGYISKTFDLRWLAGNSLDRQEDSNLDERDKISDYLKRITNDQLVASTNAAKLTCDNVNQILSGLSGVQVEEKRLARIALEAIKELIELEEPGSIKHLLPVAKTYLGLRIKDINNILYYLKTARLEPFRRLVREKNNDFINRLKTIENMLKKAKHDKATRNAYGLLQAVKPYLTEPDLKGLEPMLRAAINGLNRAKPARAEFWLKLAGNKLKDSQLLNELMVLFRDEHVSKRRDGNPQYLKEDTFIDVFEGFVKQKQLIRGSPRTRALQILFYLAVFTSLYIDNPIKPSERMLNPVFEPIDTLRLLVEADNIDTIIRIKTLKKLSRTIGVLNRLRAKEFIHALDLEERRQLIRAMAEDFGLSDKERFELAKAFAISRENLRKAYSSSADKLNPQPTVPNAENLAKEISRVINEKPIVKGKNKREYRLRPAIAKTADEWVLEVFIYPGEETLKEGFLGSIRLTVTDSAAVMINDGNIYNEADQRQGLFTHILKMIFEASDEQITLTLYKIEEPDTLIGANKLLAPIYLSERTALILEKAEKSGSEAVRSYKEFLHDDLAEAILRGATIDTSALSHTPIIRALQKAGYSAKFFVETEKAGRQIKPVVNIMAFKAYRQIDSKSEVTAATLNLGQAIANTISSVRDIASEDINGKAIILYADDILERGAAGDLMYTLGNTQILDNSTIVIYGRNPCRTQLLERIMNEAVSGKNINVIKIEEEELRGYNGYEQINALYPNEAKELELMIRRLAAHHKINNRNIFGVVKGMTNEVSLEGVMKFAAEKSLPVVSFEDDKGIYSFSNALAQLIAIANDDTPPANREWYRILKPIEKEDIEKAYQDYRRVLEIAINA